MNTEKLFIGFLWGIWFSAFAIQFVGFPVGGVSGSHDMTLNLEFGFPLCVV